MADEYESRVNVGGCLAAVAGSLILFFACVGVAAALVWLGL